MKALFITSCLLISVLLFGNDSIPDTTKRQYFPHIVHLQYAGNMGFLSLGASYKFAKEKLTLGALGGYLPASIGGTRLGTLTIKFGYRPWLLDCNWKEKKWTIIPLVVGMNLIKTWGENIESKWPSYYPDGYYPWNPSMNYAIYFGSNVDIVAKKQRKLYRAIGLFYEVGITSRTVELWWDNPKSIGFNELWNLSIGFNYHLR